VAVATAEEPETPPSPSGNGGGKVASVVSPRPVVPPTGVPEGVRTQRLLTVVKARAIQNVKAEPTDKVNTWPHLMLLEFGALLAITGLLVSCR
jgi:menaquinol-cytochrome c reductase cytochrome b/c subunit